MNGCYNRLFCKWLNTLLFTTKFHIIYNQLFIRLRGHVPHPNPDLALYTVHRRVTGLVLPLSFHLGDFGVNLGLLRPQSFALYALLD